MLGYRPRNPLNLSHGVFVPFLLMFLCCVGYPGPSLIAGPGRPRALVQSSDIKMGEVKGPSHTQANAVRACETTDMQ